MLIPYLFGVSVIVSMALFLTDRLKRKMDETLALSIFALIGMLYVGGLAGNLKLGVYAGLLAAACSAGYMVYALWQHKKQGSLAELKGRILTPGFAYFCLFAAFSAVIVQNRKLVGWDEFSHWGLVVKNMAFFDQFGNIPQATTSFKGYPPATGLLQYFFVKLCGSEFVEASLYQANNLWIAALLVLFLKDTSFREWKDMLLRCALIFLVPLIYFNAYTSIYVDAMLGLLFAHALYAYFSVPKMEMFDSVYIGMSLFMLTLVKASGFGLALIAFLIMAVDGLVRKNDTAQEAGVKKAVPFIIPIAAVLLAKCSWAIYLKISETGEAWNTSSITLHNLLALFSDAAPYQVNTLRAFGQALFAGEPYGVFRISPAAWFVVYGLMGAAACLLTEQKAEKKRMVVLNAGVLIGFVVYACTLLILYLFTYGETESQQLASFTRYMSTYFLGACLLEGFVLLDQVKRAARLKIMLPLAAVLAALLCIPMNRMEKLTRSGTQHTHDWRSTFWVSEWTQPLFDVQKDKIYTIAQGSKGFEWWTIHYNLSPVQSESDLGWSLGKPEDGDSWTRDVSAQTWAKCLKENQYTYVYLHEVNEAFAERFACLFENPEDIQDDRFYQVRVSETGDVQLVYDETKVPQV